MRVRATDDEWSARTVIAAFAIAALMLVTTVAMARKGMWPDLPWSELAFPGVVGAVYLAWRHPKHWILPFAVFLPVCLFALFLLAPTVSSIFNRLFGSS